MIAKKRAPCR